MSNEQTEILRKAQAELENSLSNTVRAFESATGLSVINVAVEHMHAVGGRRGGELIAVRTEVQL